MSATLDKSVLTLFDLPTELLSDIYELALLESIHPLDWWHDDYRQVYPRNKSPREYNSWPELPKLFAPQRRFLPEIDYRNKDSDGRRLGDSFDAEFERLSAIDYEWVPSISRIRKTALFYVSKRMYDIASYIFYTKADFFFNDPYALFRFGGLMKLYGRTQQITTLALEIDITGNTRYGDLWVRFVPDIASTFTALKSIGLIFLEVEIKCNWYGSLTFYEGYPDGQGEKFDKVKENLKLALKGGDFMTFICCRDG